MGQIQKSPPVKLIISIFTQQNNSFLAIEEILSKKFGPIDFSSPIIDFNHTRYYEKEFGPNLGRKLISFKKLIDSDNLWKIKIQTNKLEDKLITNSKRQFNIDPGYITQAKLILASSKNFAHRIHIRNGIYQEVTLLFKDKSFQPLPWTYPDYQNKECVDIFIKIRDILNSQLKSYERLSQLSKKL
ncbi:DUF4416 family protein [Candidatus Omnitrophota bacterium]